MRVTKLHELRCQNKRSSSRKQTAHRKQHKKQPSGSFSAPQSESFPTTANCQANHNRENNDIDKRATGRLLKIQTMNAGDYFGETGTFALSKRQGMSPMQSKEIWKSPYSVISNTKCTMLVLNKIDMVNICSDDNFEKLSKDMDSKQVGQPQIIESYLHNLKWGQLCQEVIDEVVAEQLSRQFIRQMASETHKLKKFSGFYESA